MRAGINMKLFYTPSTQHLQSSINLPAGAVEYKTFSDGELFVKINEDLKGEEVWVIAATNPPARNLLQTLLLLNALQRESAKINLLFTYFGYARQDKPESGEAASAQYICELFANFSLNKTLIIHAHSAQLKNYLDFKSIIPYQLFDDQAKNFDAVAAPDKGASELAQTIAQQCDKGLILIEKERPAKEQVRTTKITGDVAGKSVLIVDDMISTGKTIISAANMLKKHEAKSVSVMATHDLMNKDSLKRVDESIINKVYVTNTIESKGSSNKLEIINVGPFLERVITEHVNV